MATHGKYVVHVTTDNPPVYYNNEGSGYTLSGAKNFARIGSQQANDRAVTRGVRGPLVRVYRKGERMWPWYASQVNGLSGSQFLTPGEMPDKLYFEGIAQSNLTVKTVKIGKSYRAVPKAKKYREMYLVKHPAWK